MSKKKNLTKTEVKPMNLENIQDFGFPNDISLTQNVGCASDKKNKAQERKWKEA